MQVKQSLLNGPGLFWHVASQRVAGKHPGRDWCLHGSNNDSGK